MDIFTPFRSAIKIREVSRDNNIFILHYKITSLFLFGCSALVASRQYFGDPIDCIQRDDIPNDIMDTFCWIHATFTLPAAYNLSVGDEVPHPGIDKYTPGEERTYHKYYQWVCFVLFFQAICFYAPHYLWKTWEGQRLNSVVLNLNKPILKDEVLTGDIDKIATYLKRHRGHNMLYFGYFILCETLNFFNVIFQIYLVDSFLGGSFTTYGLDVIRYSEMEQDERNDPMIRVFPRMTKCTFHRYGSSGDVQRHDSLCILPLNIINEKIYIFMWFWFVFLGILSGYMLLYRLATIFKGEFRLKILCDKARFTRKDHLEKAMKDYDCGDWFILYMLCKNLDPIHFKDVINRVVEFNREVDLTIKIEKPPEGIDRSDNVDESKRGDQSDNDDESKKANWQEFARVRTERSKR